MFVKFSIKLLWFLPPNIWGKKKKLKNVKLVKTRPDVTIQQGSLDRKGKKLFFIFSEVNA